MKTRNKKWCGGGGLVLSQATENKQLIHNTKDSKRQKFQKHAAKSHHESHGTRRQTQNRLQVSPYQVLNAECQILAVRPRKSGKVTPAQAA
jgi:hypothetical protein